MQVNSLCEQLEFAALGLQGASDGVVELLVSEMTELESAIGEEELLRLFTLDEPGTGAVCELEISENSTEEDKNCAGGRLLEFSWGPIDDELSLI